MDRNRWFKQAQSAQGMVEFALVLPILLLLILGVFAFGHLFFVYSSVVSASREAARWGAAVGEAPSGEPRYQDCASIRQTAVRVGAFAGVSPSSVTVDYDGGPLTAIKANCPTTGPGPSPTIIERGDRIVVRVTVNYTPIVPLVNLPSFPLTAETARTIVKSVPVGEAPAAESPCETDSHMDPATSVPATAVVGEPVVFSTHIWTDNGTDPIGTVTFRDGTGTILSTKTLVAADHGNVTFDPVTFMAASPDPLYAISFISDDACVPSTGLDNQVYVVNPAHTTLVFEPAITADRVVGATVPFTVRLAVVDPGMMTVSGPPRGEEIFISAQDGNSCTAIIAPDLSATCSLTLERVTDAQTINAIYPGSANYLTSTTSTTMRVTPAIPELTITANPNPVVAGTPVTLTVTMTVPIGNGPQRENVTISAPGAGTCTARLSNSLVGSCTLTPTQAYNPWHIVAVYEGNVSSGGIYSSATGSMDMNVEPAPEPEFCPYFDSNRLTFDAQNPFFKINVKNRDQYDMKISAVTVSWPTSATSIRLREIRFANVVNKACTATDQNDCVWWATSSDGYLGMPSAGNLVITNQNTVHATWVSSNPGIPKSRDYTLLLNFTNNLPASGPYYLSVEFVDSSGGHRCNVETPIDYTR